MKRHEMKQHGSLPRLARFARDERGSIIVMAAILAVAAIGALAASVDAITLYFERRHAQGAVDLAAIAAARDSGRAEAAAAATIHDNGVPAVQRITVTRGHYAADAATPAGQRFVANASPLNAVRVDLVNRVPLYFGRAIDKAAALDVVTHATAVNTAEAAFSIGSRLATLNGGVLNAVLGATLGGSLSLSAMDYDSLANFNVDLFQFSNALASTAGGSIGTYDQLAAAEVSAANMLDAMAALAASAPGGAAAQLALEALKQQSNAQSLRIAAGQLIGFGPNGYLGIGQGGSAFAAKASALAIINAIAAIANGKHQAEVTAALALPGLLDVQLGVTVGERPQGSPWIVLGDKGATVYTAQTRLRLIATIGGGGILLGAKIRLPIHLDIAAASATLTDVSCGADPVADTSVTIAVTPAVIDGWIAEPRGDWAALTLPPAMRPAALMALPLLGISASGRAEIALRNTQASDVSFSWSDIANGTGKTVKTTDFTQSLAATLIGNLALTAKAGPLSLATPALVGAAVQAALAPVTPTLDALLNDALRTLGVGLGEADVWVNGVRCDGAVLVN